MIWMLAEIEDKIASLIREKLVDIPPENIIVNGKAAKPPSIVISNLKFKFKDSDLSENVDEGKIEFEENFDSDGVKKKFNLQEKPLKKSICVESPPGVVLAEKTDYTVNCDEPSIDFRKAPGKGKRNIIVKYDSEKNVMTLKSIKVKALYAIDLFGSDRIDTDSLTEKVVTALLTAEDKLFAEGIEIKPIGGMTLHDESSKTGKMQLRYIVEKEIRVKQIVGPIERIEIRSKNV